MLGELLQQVEAGPLLRGRVAGVLFNCAACSPESRSALLETGVVFGAVEVLHLKGDEAPAAADIRARVFFFD